MATIATYTVSGMTCGNCVAHVTEELMDVDGIEKVEVDLVAGGASAVHVTSAVPLAREAVAAAIDEAGYTLDFS